jgi:ComF family protein
MHAIVGRARRIALDLLFPPMCALCGRGGTMLCAPCAEALPRADGARCARCWMPVERARLCRHCATSPPAFASLRAAFVMDGGARRLAHELKYEGMTALAGRMAALMRPALPAACDAIVPVPLHGRRERARGYNQAAELARHLAQASGVELLRGAARRTRNTPPLVKTMGRAERLDVMRGAFAARPAAVEGRAVLLVDDVVTTGATLSACAEALLAAGARSVHAVTWARAD